MTGPAQMPLPWPVEVSNAREDIVLGEANRLAVGAVDAWPAWPHPVLFLSGPPGSGKTHLARVWQEASGASVFDPRRFGPASRDFAVLVDDVDRAAPADGALFALLNAARLGGGTVLLTARMHPAELPVALPDLRSRLTAATLVAIDPPDDALLGAVLAKLFADRQIEFDPRLLPDIVSRMERSLGAARDLVARIDRETLARRRRPTRRLVLELLRARDPDEAVEPS